MRPPLALAAVLAVLAFVAGRATAPAPVAGTATPVSVPAGQPAATASTGEARPGPTTTAPTATPPGSTGTDTDGAGAGPTTTTTTTSPAGVPVGAAAVIARPPPATCEARLEEVQAELGALVKRREELEGKPIPARDDVAPRFASAGLLGTFQRGFSQSGVKGQVESVDCSEHPCILFGRLEGDEAEVAKLEDSAVFSAYDDDIGVMLTWASGHGGHDDDHAAKSAGAGREKPEEVSLFAFAFYGVDEEARSEQIDRRIRTRTAEYWNASRPRE